jgi:hypothetical protein
MPAHLLLPARFNAGDKPLRKCKSRRKLSRYVDLIDQAVGAGTELRARSVFV